MGVTIDADVLREEVYLWGMNDYEPSDFTDAIDDSPTVEAIPIPKGVTNGEMLLALFPDTKCFQNNGIINTDIDDGTLFNEDWWEAPYKRGNANENDD